MHFPAALSLLLSALSLVVNASPIRPADIKSNVAKGLRLLSLAEGTEPVWKTENEVFDLLRAGVKFVRFLFQCPDVQSNWCRLIVRCH